MWLSAIIVISFATDAATTTTSNDDDEDQPTNRPTLSSAWQRSTTAAIAIRAATLCTAAAVAESASQPAALPPTALSSDKVVLYGRAAMPGLCRSSSKKGKKKHSLCFNHCYHLFNPCPRPVCLLPVCYSMARHQSARRVHTGQHTTADDHHLCAATRNE